MAVRRRRKGQPTVNIVSFDARTLQEIEMLMRDAERQEISATRFAEKNHHSKRANQSLSETVSSAVQQMQIEDA